MTPRIVLRLALLFLLFLLALLGSSCESPYAAPRPVGGASPSPGAGRPAASVAPSQDASGLGEGFVVWESNRSGDFRIWIRDLQDGEPRQLSGDEDGGRQHCCPHVAPGGDGVAYLSLAKGGELYPASGAVGALHLIRVDGTEDRVLTEQAATYSEHRAVVWRSIDELILIGGDWRTRLLSVHGGDPRLLTEAAPERNRGWLINRTLTHATSGEPSFSTYDPENRRVEVRRDFGGCQPYFSFDGRWGYWIAGAGGPIRRIDLVTRRTGTVLAKSDPRLPSDQGYLYFPMLSHDGRLLAFAASRDRHDHHTEDYDVFVVETDPRTLEAVSRAVRITDHPATDRYPDVYSAPLALGRHFAEAPHTLELTAPEGGSWRFLANGVEIAAGETVRHTFEAGTYALEARRGETVLRGMATFSVPRPPRVDAVEVRGGRRVVVRFDEEVATDDLRLELESGRPFTWRLVERGRSLVVELESALEQTDVLRLAGLRDRAQTPNVLPETSLTVTPPTWPVDPRGLVFLWESDGGQNQVEDRETGAMKSTVLEPNGRAWLDRHLAMELHGGYFSVDAESMRTVLHGCRRTSEITVEATVTPAATQGASAGRILTFSTGERDRNFTLGQEDGRLVFRLRTSSTGRNATRPQLDLAPLPAGRASHVVVTYTPGRLAAYVDGRQVLSTDVVRSGFFHWKPRAFLFGNESRGVERSWYGKVEAVAVYNRFMAADEVSEAARRAAKRIAERPAVDSVQVRARLRRRSPTPSLAEISPYRDALAVFEYETVAGELPPGREVRVVHRVLADGEELAVARRRSGEAYELRLEPFLEQPQLQSLFLSNVFGEETTLFWSDDVEP